MDNKENINYADELITNILLSILKGEKECKVVLHDISETERQRLCEVTNTKCFRANENQLSFVYIINENQISYADNLLKFVSPYTMKLCENAATDRMKRCLKYHKSPPAWAINALKRVIANSSDAENLKLTFLVHELKVNNLIDENTYLYMKKEK